MINYGNRLCSGTNKQKYTAQNREREKMMKTKRRLEWINRQTVKEFEDCINHSAQRGRVIPGQRILWLSQHCNSQEYRRPKVRSVEKENEDLDGKQKKSNGKKKNSKRIWMMKCPRVGLWRILGNGKMEITKLEQINGALTSNRGGIIRTVGELYLALYSTKQDTDPDYSMKKIINQNGVIKNRGSR